MILCIIYNFINKIKFEREIEVYLVEDNDLGHKVFEINQRHLELGRGDEKAVIQIIDRNQIFIKSNMDDEKCIKFGDTFTLNKINYRIDDRDSIQSIKELRGNALKKKKRRFAGGYGIVIFVLLSVVDIITYNFLY